MSDEINDLISEARQCHQARGWSKDPLVDKLENLANRLADALEAATRQPSEDDREAKAEALKEWQSGNELRQYSEFYTSWEDGYEAGFSRAAVLDAATELRAERDAALARIAELEAELAASDAAFRSLKVSTGPTDARLTRAEARIAEAAKLHRPRKHWNSDREYVFVCDECTRINRYGIAQWPCPTAVALGLNEGENGVS